MIQQTNDAVVFNQNCTVPCHKVTSTVKYDSALNITETFKWRCLGWDKRPRYLRNLWKISIISFRIIFEFLFSDVIARAYLVIISPFIVIKESLFWCVSTICTSYFYGINGDQAYGTWEINLSNCRPLSVTMPHERIGRKVNNYGVL
jgi:hypothetical protein